MSDVAVWITIFIFGLFCLNWPLLEIFHESPFAYLLAFWLFFMVLVGRVARDGKEPPAR